MRTDPSLPFLPEFVATDGLALIIVALSRPRRPAPMIVIGMGAWSALPAGPGSI